MARNVVGDILELQVFLGEKLKFDYSKQFIFEDIEFDFDLEENFNRLKYLEYPNGNGSISTKFESINEYLFINCSFNKSLNTYGKFDKQLTFKKNCIFNDINLSETFFVNKIRFHQCKFNGTSKFENTKFENLVDYWGSEFINPIQFYKTDFLKTTVFSACIFHENALFTYALFNGKTFFRGTRFKKGMDLSLSINSGEFNFFNLFIGNFKSIIHNSEEDYMDLLKRNEIPTINKKETYRLLKQYFEKNGDDLEYIKYLKLEKSPIIDILEYEVRISNSKLTLNSINKIFEILSIRLNEISNNHRDSYVRGILFTLVVGFIFFTLTVITLPNYKFELLPTNWYMDDFGKYFFAFMNPTHNNNLFEKLCPTGYTFFWQTLGRIFIGYGIYQTVQAFRKLK